MTSSATGAAAPDDLVPFDLLGALPEGPTTTVLEASAGTGKTYTLAGLVARYVAEGRARLEEMLLITFGRAASQELRERVRDQLDEAHDALRGARAAREGDPVGSGGAAYDGVTTPLLDHLLDADPDELGDRERRLRDALADFDAATIATTHQFCQLVLRSLGVAGDSDSGVTLVEDLSDLVGEIVDDLYLARFGQAVEDPELTRAAAFALATTAVANPGAVLTPRDPEPGTTAAVRVGFARDVLAELERRKRRMGVLGYDDLLGRLADALADPDAPARQRMRTRWRVVMVDEFQDTDPVQWQVVERAFAGHATVVLIGDPKQAIYGFRGGDVVTYLQAARSAEQRCTLATNYRSDGPLVDSLLAVLRGAALGHPDIVVRDVGAHQATGRLRGAPCNDPFRLRVVTREKFDIRTTRTVPMDRVRAHVAADLAADVAGLLASGATWDGRPVEARDVAVIVERHGDARTCRDALAAAGVPAVYTGDSDVLGSAAAEHWLALLEAFEQPYRAGLVRAAAVTPFLGRTPAELGRRGDDLTDEVAETLRRWADHARRRGVAAVLEAAVADGMAARVLAHRGGERDLTDLTHVGQVLHETAHRDRLGLPALLEWLRAQRRDEGGDAVRNRRLDSDAAAVQVMTVWVAKGLQFPVVYLPFAFNRNVQQRESVLHHEGDQRCLDVGGSRPGSREVEARGRSEEAGDATRLTYVALTRAQSQVVAWWAPSYDEPNGGLSRLLRDRRPGQAEVPERLSEKPADTDVLAQLRAWQSVGGPRVEQSLVAAPPAVPLPTDVGRLGVRRFTRPIDAGWRRTSYSGLVRAAEEARGATSEPEVGALDDEADDLLATGDEPRSDGPAGTHDVASPMADLPSGAAFGSLVHAVLEDADPDAPDLAEELEARVREHAAFWPVEVAPAALAAALVPLHDTPLGPLAPGRTLRSVALADRLCELDFELPLGGGDLVAAGGAAAEAVLADVGRLLRTHLAPDDPVAPYADRLLAPGLGDQPLRGYLSGSIDVVLRLRETAGADPRYVVVDYKTNRLGDPEQSLTTADYAPDRVTAAMLHSDYPLQALLYTAVLHRFLRWRQPGYDPDRHLGGLLYLYLRGMAGVDTPVTDGHPAGVFSWRPPTALVLALSDLLDGRGPT
ncbi:RecBCD enzyme subunit RecB [Nocardioides aquaticus]|uniref:RecBCD enzyme subunit RecB n=1 Tax=Nocardioides aquaticus TaxID=160826 RepID=A0ABX8EBY6_9ACTN|nr:UvrD-helicase domain-containing protein [Nocardioides aquaticus]QVT77937.1 RecBCD enzyme subunit RecB [Nocardioides aquaticus]